MVKIIIHRLHHIDLEPKFHEAIVFIDRCKNTIKYFDTCLDKKYINVCLYRRFLAFDLGQTLKDWSHVIAFSNKTNALNNTENDLRS